VGDAVLGPHGDAEIEGGEADEPVLELARHRLVEAEALTLGLERLRADVGAVGLELELHHVTGA